MPKNIYPGKRVITYYNSTNYYETKINFNIIYNNHRLNRLEKPIEQGALNIDKVYLMITEYKLDPSLLRFKNRVVIGVLNDTWYIVDGQHRIEMAKKLYNELHIDDELIFCWYLCTNEDQMRTLFISINHDSTKNQFYIKQTNLTQLKINEFTKLLKKYYKSSFSNKKTKIGKIKTIEEFRDDLISIKFFETDKTTQQLLDIIKHKNHEFFELVRFKIELEHNPCNFYKDEIKHIENMVIFSLKNTNFINWMRPDVLIDPIHTHKKVKKGLIKN